MAIDFDVSKGLSGGFSGASAGFGIGGPVGAGIGAAIGLGSGFFGQEEERENPYEDVVNMLEGRLEGERRDSPTDQTVYQAGLSEAQEQVERQARQDAGQAAARGLEGSQFAVAQDANRADALANMQTDLLKQAARVDRQEEQNAFQRLTRARMQSAQFEGNQAARNRKRQSQQDQLVQQALMGLGGTVAGMEGGPPLEDALNNFFGIGQGGGGESPPFTPGPSIA